MAFAIDGDMLKTSFETSDGYTLNAINGQQKWITTSGTATVATTAKSTGDNGLHLQDASGSLQMEYTGYSKTETGLTGLVYVDLYINLQTLETANFQLMMYDYTPNSSSKRTAMIEFLKPNSTTGNIKVYNGSSGANEGTYTLGDWKRISMQLDMDANQYKIAINGVVVDKTFTFRETYTPADLGRASGNKEVHAIRFANSSNSTTSSVFIDDIYVGTDPIDGVSFGGASTVRAVVITQPDHAQISVQPLQSEYHIGDFLTFTCAVDTGYQFTHWTGSLVGTDNPDTITITNNISIGAAIGIDVANPPAIYTLTVVQPNNGIISIRTTPVTHPTDHTYTFYDGTTVSAQVQNDACYVFQGWTGALSGTNSTSSFVISKDTTIGAVININAATPTKHTAVSASTFKTALAGLHPGDTLELTDGTFDIGNCIITTSGCSDNPIIIRAANTGQVTLINSSAFTLRHVEYVTIEGFVFASTNVTVIKTEGARFCHITRNIFHLTETTSVKWILIGNYYSDTILLSWNNRIDYNLFENKTQGGNFITIDGCSSSGELSRYDVIAFNHFRNNTPRAANEKESIRIGVSGLSMSSGYTVVEYNLFENCDGDPEIISVKACDNIVRYNTFIECLGTVCLRHGFRNRVEGNYFFGNGKTVDGNGCGGVRVYGIDHVIVNNYFDHLTGEKWDPVLALTNGDVTNSSTSHSAHFLPENVIFANNTLINNKSDIEIGFTNNGNYGKIPINCKIENNIIVNNTNTIVKSYSSAALAAVAFSNNIFYPTGSAQVGITYTPAQVNLVDPQLVHTTCPDGSTNCTDTLPVKVYKIGSGSPAIDAITGIPTYLTTDFEKQSRTGNADIGADEYRSDPITIGALTPDYVGPNAIPFFVNNATPTNNAVKYDADNTLNCYYHLSEHSIEIKYQSPVNERIEWRLIGLLGQTVMHGYQAVHEGMNTLHLSTQSLPKGVYIYQVQSHFGTHQVKLSAW
ncbi:hypothetical protein FACS1894201_04520 [Bacteroidia bacterium]|nr:hypothetical protein FACS1894201_04520 [Bacteroidia bacterium]